MKKADHVSQVASQLEAVRKSLPQDSGTAAMSAEEFSLVYSFVVNVGSSLGNRMNNELFRSQLAAFEILERKRLRFCLDQ